MSALTKFTLLFCLRFTLGLSPRIVVTTRRFASLFHFYFKIKFRLSASFHLCVFKNFALSSFSMFSDFNACLCFLCLLASLQNFSNIPFNITHHKRNGTFQTFGSPVQFFFLSFYLFIIIYFSSTFKLFLHNGWRGYFKK